jgi:glycine oxidase
VHGQIISLRVAAAPSQVVSGAGVYLIPRSDETGQRVWVGATTEAVGFQKRITARGREALAAGAGRVLPALAGAEVVEHWAGLRPGTPDGLPVLGADPALEGLVYATGHFRNGLLLAPVTADLTARVLGGERPAALEPFRAERFAADIEAPLHPHDRRGSGNRGAHPAEP